jgi:hypothetical protein
VNLLPLSMMTFLSLGVQTSSVLGEGSEDGIYLFVGGTSITTVLQRYFN